MAIQSLVPPRFFTRECLELNELSSRNQWQTDYRQLGCGDFEAWFEFYSCASIKLTSQFCSREMLVSGTPPPGHTALVLPLAPGKPAIFNGSELGVYEAFLIGAETETHLRTPADLQLITVTIPTGPLLSQLSSFGCEERSLITGWRSIKLSAGISASLRSAINRVFRLVQGQAAQANLNVLLLGIEKTVIDQIATALSNPRTPVSHTRARRNHLRCLRRARDYIEENLSSALSLHAIAVASGASLRTLEMAFQEVLGLTPVQYIKNLRLIGVNRGLLHPQGGTMTVSALAREHGFNHMGRFAKDYQALFNEYPSVSLEHGRRSQAQP